MRLSNTNKAGKEVAISGRQEKSRLTYMRQEHVPSGQMLFIQRRITLYKRRVLAGYNRIYPKYWSTL